MSAKYLEDRPVVYSVRDGFPGRAAFCLIKFSPKSRLEAAGVGCEATSSSDNYARTLILYVRDREDRQSKIVLNNDTANAIIYFSMGIMDGALIGSRPRPHGGSVTKLRVFYSYPA